MSPAWIGAAALGGAAIAVATAGVSRHRFLSHIDDLQHRLDCSPAAGSARTDLPPEVWQLARRLGAYESGAGPTVHLTQEGEMWLKSDGDALPFAASQTLAVAEVGFLWRAKFRISGLPAQIVDYVVQGEAGLEGRLLDSVPLVNFRGDDQAFRGEAMRYLAELPWVPDAIMCNPHLRWHVIDTRTLCVSTGDGARRCEVRLKLNEAGDPVGFEADDRPFSSHGKFIPTPWFGHYSDYQIVNGRRMPMRGEAGWHLDSTDFIYWRGEVKSWALGEPLTVV